MPCVEGHSNCVFNEQFLTANVTLLWLFTQSYVEKSLYLVMHFVLFVDSMGSDIPHINCQKLFF